MYKDGPGRALWDGRRGDSLGQRDAALPDFKYYHMIITLIIIIVIIFTYTYLYIYIYRAYDIPAPWCFLHTTYFIVHKVLRAHKRLE